METNVTVCKIICRMTFCWNWWWRKWTIFAFHSAFGLERFVTGAKLTFFFVGSWDFIQKEREREHEIYLKMNQKWNIEKCRNINNEIDWFNLNDKNYQNPKQNVWQSSTENWNMKFINTKKSVSFLCFSEIYQEISLKWFIFLDFIPIIDENLSIFLNKIPFLLMRCMNPVQKHHMSIFAW